MIGTTTTMTTDERKQAADEVKRLRSDLESALPALLAAERKAEQKVATAREKLRTEEERRVAALNARRNAVTRSEALICDLELALIASSDPQIAAFIRRCIADEERTRRGPLPATLVSFPNPNTGWPDQQWRGDGRPVVRRLEALRAARKRAGVLQLQALPSAEITKTLTAMWDTLPSVEDAANVEVPA